MSTSTETDTTNQDVDDAPYASSHLRALLQDAGVGSKVSIRDVAKNSRQQLNREWIRLLLQPIPAGERGHRYDVENLRALAETLQCLDIKVTFGQIEHAVLADLGFPMAVSSYTETSQGDLLSEVLQLIELLSDRDRRVVLMRLSTLLAPTE